MLKIEKSNIIRLCSHRLLNKAPEMVSETSFSGLLALNDDCFECIFVWLTFEELCSFGGTCKHLQCIAGQYVGRKYRAKKMQISREYGKLLILPNGIEHLSQYIQNVEIHGSELELFEYVRKNCSEHVQRIGLFGGYRLSTGHITNLRRFLGNVKAVVLYCCVFAHSFYETFLQYCQSLEALCIAPFLYDGQCNGSDGDWLKHEYAGLKQFQYDGLEMTAIVGEFLQRNKSIASFSAPLATLATVLDACPVRFREICLRLRPQKRSQPIEQICDRFKRFSMEKRFDRVHLVINDRDIFVNNSDSITALSAVQELTLDFYFVDAIGMASLLAVATWAHLKVLNVRHIGHSAEMLSKSLPQLEVLRVADDSLSACEPFIRNHCNVRIICIEKCKKSDSTHFSRLNAERSKLVTWQKLHLYVGELAFVEIRRSTSTVRFTAIEIKLIDSQFSMRHATPFPESLN